MADDRVDKNAPIMGRRTFILNELETWTNPPYNFKDGEICTIVWTCKCGTDYFTVDHCAIIELDFHCPCGAYYKRIDRIPNKNVKRREYFNLRHEKDGQ